MYPHYPDGTQTASAYRPLVVEPSKRQSSHTVAALAVTLSAVGFYATSPEADLLGISQSLRARAEIFVEHIVYTVDRIQDRRTWGV